LAIVSLTLHREYDAYISRIDWNHGSSGKHSFSWRGNLQNHSEPTAPVFPGQPPQAKVLINNKRVSDAQSFGEATLLLTNYRLAQLAARLEF
jgi:hypothetical protein